MYVSERNQPKWRQQPTTNFTYSVYRTALAKLTKQRPTFLVVPATGDSDDRASAELGLALLKFWYAELRTPKIVRKMLAWVLTAGTGYINADWDPEAGAVQELRVSHTDAAGKVTDDVPADENGDPYLTDEGAPDMEQDPHRVGLGDVRISSVDPMWVRYNPEAESPDEAEEWFVGEPSSATAVAEQFDLDVSEIDGAMDDELISVTDMITSAVAGSGVVAPFASGSDNTQAKGKRTLCSATIGSSAPIIRKVATGFRPGERSCRRKARCLRDSGRRTSRFRTHRSPGRHTRSGCCRT
jgi:hypothetical protein